MSNDIPIVCTLNDAEFRERERVVLEKLKSAMRETAETVDGYTFSFTSDDELLRDLSEFIILERRCCPFLDFSLKVGRGGGDIVLELSGPDGAKEFIASTFAP